MENQKSNYDILFIGGVYEEGKEKEYLKKTLKGGIQNAVNTHQWSFIKAIELYNDRPIDILSAPYVAAFPNFLDIYVKKNNWQHVQGAYDENIGFLNISIIKNLIRKFKLALKAIKWSKKKKLNNKIIICYYPSIPQMNAVHKVKKYTKNVKSILIVPDIPQFMDLKSKKNCIKKIFSNLIETKQDNLIQKFDAYIFLTENMKYALKIHNKPYLVIEGIFDNTSNISLNIRHLKKFSIVYSGSLHKKYGIESYLNAIKKINNQDIDFYFFGSGEMEDEIKNISYMDSRIKFMGYANREIVMEYQRSANLLINPRVTNEEFVKYSFPSKLIEYMVSGTPVLTTKLPSIPNEYDEYLYYIESSNQSFEENIKSSILKIINLPNKELIIKGKNAKQFILNNKTCKSQGKKIYKLLNEL